MAVNRMGITKMTRILRLKASIQGTQPPIWRRLELSADLSLHGLHQVLQDAFGWSNTHLHAFDVAGQRLAPPDPESGTEILDSRKQPLADFEGRVDCFHYNYDFGDDWLHSLKIEAWADAVPGVHYPRCIAGARACPPEDCGGPPGYEDLLKALGDAKHERHEELKEWVGDYFDPKCFDVAEVNASLKRLRLPKPKESPGPWIKAMAAGPKPVVDDREYPGIVESMLADLKGVKMTPELEKLMQALVEARLKGVKVLRKNHE